MDRSQSKLKGESMSKLELFCLASLFMGARLVQGSDLRSHMPILKTPKSVLQDVPAVNPYSRSATLQMQRVILQLAQVEFGSVRTGIEGDKSVKSFSLGAK